MTFIYSEGEGGEGGIVCGTRLSASRDFNSKSINLLKTLLWNRSGRVLLAAVSVAVFFIDFLESVSVSNDLLIGPI